MLEMAQSLVLRFFTIIRMFSFKQNGIRLMGPDPTHGQFSIHFLKKVMFDEKLCQIAQRT